MSKGRGKPEKDLKGFNALPAEARLGRRRSSLEDMLIGILESSSSLQVRTAEFRRVQAIELARAETIVKQCDEMVSMHQEATQVIAAVRWKRKLKRGETAPIYLPSHDSESQGPNAEELARQEAARQEASRLEALADIAKLQCMVNNAKQSNGMQLLAQIWTGMLRGSFAMLVLVWATNALGPRDLVTWKCKDGEEDIPRQPADKEEEEEEEDYMCEITEPEPKLIPSPDRLLINAESPHSSPIQSPPYDAEFGLGRKPNKRGSTVENEQPVQQGGLCMGAACPAPGDTTAKPDDSSLGAQLNAKRSPEQGFTKPRVRKNIPS